MTHNSIDPAWCHARLAALVASEHGLETRDDGTALALPELGLSFAVAHVMAEGERPPPGEFRTIGLVMRLWSQDLFASGGAIEYAYGFGTDDEAAADYALRVWTSCDLPVLIEATRGEAGICDRMDITMAQGQGAWQIYLGPMTYVAGSAGSQPCCKACLFTANMDILMQRLQANTSSAVKLVATRSSDGEIGVDCRVDGEDWLEAQEAISRTVAGWPAPGETLMRRQYMVFRAPPA